MPLESPGAQRQRFGKWVNQYLRLMEAAMTGQYELLHPGFGFLSSTTTSMPEVHLRAVLRQKDLVFRSEIEATKSNGSWSSTKPAPGERLKSQTDVNVGDRVVVRLERQRTLVCKVAKTRGTDVWCNECPEWLGGSRWSFTSDTADTVANNGSTTLRQFIQANRGDELAIFPSYRVFCSCVQRCVGEWKIPATKLLEHYHTQTGSTSHHIISLLLSGRGNVRVERFFKETTDRVLAMLKESAQRELELLLQHEARPYTQDQRLYDELDRLRQQELHARLEAALPAGDRHGLVSIATVIRALGDISMGPFGMSLDDREALEMEVALRAYLEVASHRFVDVVPMKLNGLLLESFVREMESVLLGAATDAKVAELLQESDSQALRRHQLLRELGTLEEGKQILEKTEGLQG
ncbi:hypothetical protein ON010_g15972 [Phytophthora cinnamomi]|nr:hypothetical protein ON010_g15972 [Phytophthora cinnamomi]